MENKKFKPLLDKLFWITSITTGSLLLFITVPLAIFQHTTLFFTLPICLFVAYFLISPLFGYVQLREDSVFIKFGFILKKEIAYKSIRGTEKQRRLYSDSMLSLKNAVEHVNIKYNTFDVISVSVVGNDELIKNLNDRLGV